MCISPDTAGGAGSTIPMDFPGIRANIICFTSTIPMALPGPPCTGGTRKTKDFIKWELVPCALAPDTEYDGQGCFQGARWSTTEKHILMYTSVYDGLQEDGTHKNKADQSIAIGDGVNYEKLSCNPVIKSDAPCHRGSLWWISAIRESGRKRYLLFCNWKPGRGWKRAAGPVFSADAVK